MSSKSTSEYGCRSARGKSGSSTNSPSRSASFVSVGFSDKATPQCGQRKTSMGIRVGKNIFPQAIAEKMNPRQKRIWRLQRMAVKKQQAFQEALQTIPVSEMEKMVAASQLDLERATQNYERFLVAHDGKGRYLWRKLREKTATMDTETKLRIKLLPINDSDTHRGSYTGGSDSQASSKTSSPRTATPNRKSATPRSKSKPGSRNGTPRSHAGRFETPIRGSGSRMSTPRSLLRAAAQKAAGAPTKVEIFKRAQQTTFKWRTSTNVKLATDLPQELLQYRYDHKYDKYNRSSNVMRKVATNAGQAGMQKHRRCGGNEGLQGRILGGCQGVPGKKLALQGGEQCSGGTRETSAPRDAKHYGEQWYAPPKLWTACGAARKYGEDPKTDKEASEVHTRASEKQRQLQGQLVGDQGARLYARHLQQANKRVPEYLKTVCKEQ